MFVYKDRLMRRMLIAFALVFTMVIQSFGSFAFSATSVKPSFVSVYLVIDGEQSSVMLPLKIVNGSVMTSLKSLALAFDDQLRSISSGTVKYVWVLHGTTKYRFTISSAKARIYELGNDPQDVWLSQPAQVLSNTLYVPLKDIAALFGLDAQIQRNSTGAISNKSVVLLNTKNTDSESDIFTTIPDKTIRPIATPITKPTNPMVSGAISSKDFVINDRGYYISMFLPEQQLDTTIQTLQQRETSQYQDNGLVYPGKIYAFPAEQPKLRMYIYDSPVKAESFILSVTCQSCTTARNLIVGKTTYNQMISLYGNPDAQSVLNGTSYYTYQYLDHKLIFSQKNDSGPIIQAEIRHSLKDLVKVSVDANRVPTIIMMTPIPTGNVSTPTPFFIPTVKPTPYLTPQPYNTDTPQPTNTQAPTPTPTPFVTPTATPTATPIVLGVKTTILQSGKWINDVAVNQSRYKPGQAVRIEVTLSNPDGSDRNGEVQAIVKHLDQSVATLVSDPISLRAGQKSYITLSFDAPRDDYKGYLIDAYFISNHEVLDQRSGAFDVSSDWSRFPRYGYITDYPYMSDSQTSQIISRLNRFHINSLQFYDWQWKHHLPIKMDGGMPASQWKDIANREVYLTTIKSYVASAHDRNMLAFNYNLMFGSYINSSVDGVSRDWGLFKDRNRNQQDAHPLPDSWASNRILLENPSNTSWQNYIINGERDALRYIAFDGWHIDQLGDRGQLYDANGNQVQLDQTYGPMIQNIKQQLNTRLVMNAVSEYGVNSIANSPVDVLYTEVWPPTNGGDSSYNQLKRAVETGLSLGNGRKGQVIAAYMNYQAAEQPGMFNEYSVLLTDATIMAAGGSHLELGDTGMLGKEYFPNKNLKISSNLDEQLKHYYDFSVAYQNWLRDGVRPVDIQVDSSDVRISSSNSPASGSVWTFARERQGQYMVHLINLTGNQSVNWRDDYANSVTRPREMNQLHLSMSVPIRPQQVLMASPDQDLRTREIPFTVNSRGSGYVVDMVVPKLNAWDMIMLK